MKPKEGCELQTKIQLQSIVQSSGVSPANPNLSAQAERLAAAGCVDISKMSLEEKAPGEAGQVYKSKEPWIEILESEELSFPQTKGEAHKGGAEDCLIFPMSTGEPVDTSK